jgi:GT2 family glycosyltransferase
VNEKIGAVQVAAIVVNYRTPDLTIACVESLLASSDVDLHVVVVDNRSGDGSADRFRARFGDAGAVTIVAREVNDGYTGGNNAGAAVARRLGARYALVLNSDTTLEADCLRHLLDEAQGPARPALVSPQIVFGDQPDMVWWGGGRFSLWAGRPVHVGYRKPVRPASRKACDLPFATGCALLVDLDQVGDPLFDVSLFSYAEDLDLSLRVRESGRRIRYVPAAVVHHFEGASHRKAGGQALRFYLNTRNLLRVVARHARWYHWITLGPMLATDVIGRFCVVALRDRDFAAFGAVLRGAADAIGRNYGKSFATDDTESTELHTGGPSRSR